MAATKRIRNRGNPDREIRFPEHTTGSILLAAYYWLRAIVANSNHPAFGPVDFVGPFAED